MEHYTALIVIRVREYVPRERYTFELQPGVCSVVTPDSDPVPRVFCQSQPRVFSVYLLSLCVGSVIIWYSTSDKIFSKSVWTPLLRPSQGPLLCYLPGKWAKNKNKNKRIINELKIRMNKCFRCWRLMYSSPLCHLCVLFKSITASIVGSTFWRPSRAAAGGQHSGVLVSRRRKKCISYSSSGAKSVDQ